MKNFTEGPGTIHPKKDDPNLDSKVFVANIHKLAERRKNGELLNPFDEYKTRQLEVNIFQVVGMGSYLGTVSRLVSDVSEGKKGMTLSQNPVAVAKVAESTAMQKALLDAPEEEIEKPGFLTNYIDRKKAAEAKLARELEAQKKPGGGLGGVSVSNSQDQVSEEPAMSPGSVQESVKKTDEIIARFQARNGLGGLEKKTPPDVGLSKDKKVLRPSMSLVVTKVDTIDLGGVPKKIEPYFEEQPSDDNLLENGGIKTEDVVKGLVDRNKANISVLEKFGLTKAKSKGLKGLMGSLEVFGKMTPKSLKAKIALQVGLASLALLTGGATALVSGAVQTGTLAAGIYKKHLAKYEKPSDFSEWFSSQYQKGFNEWLAEQEEKYIQSKGEFSSEDEKVKWQQVIKNKQVDSYTAYREKNIQFWSLSDEEKQKRKEKHAVRAVLFGITLTAGMSYGAKFLSPYISEAAHAVGEKVGHMTTSVSDFFNTHSTPTQPQVTSTSPVSSSGLSGTPDTSSVASAPSTPTPVQGTPLQPQDAAPAPVQNVVAQPAPQPEVIDWGKAERIQKYVAAMGRRAAGPSFYIQGDAEIIALGDPRL